MRLHLGAEKILEDSGFGLLTMPLELRKHGFGIERRRITIEGSVDSLAFGITHRNFSRIGWRESPAAAFRSVCRLPWR